MTPRRLERIGLMVALVMGAGFLLLLAKGCTE